MAVSEEGGRALVVGGAVRDACLGMDPKDLDLEVYGLGPERLARCLEQAGLRIDAVGRAFGVLKVSRAGEGALDVSLPRSDSKTGRGHRGFLVTPDPAMRLEEAAARRDFTMNAMAWDPVRGELLDPYGGVADLERRVLRHVGPAFVEDPLRVLRGFQFAGRFDLEAAPETIELSRTLLGEAAALPVERVWEEWRKWAGRSRRPSAGLRFLAACGWVDRLPELVALQGCSQDPSWHPEGDVWTHTLLACDAAVKIAGREGLEENEQVVLVLAALVHDLGKPSTTTRDDDGKIRSRGHAEAVATYESLLATIACPASLSQRVVALSRRHLDHMNLHGSKRAVRRLARFLGEHGETIAGLVRLIEADHTARPPLPGGLPKQAASLLCLAEEVRLLDAAPRPLLLGRHLLPLGVPPGPEMGRWLAAAYDAQLDGAFEDLEGALTWMRLRLSVSD